MKISVLGTGSFGTSLAMVLTDNQHDVMMYGRNQAVVDEINNQHTNGHYLKDINLPEALYAVSDLEEAVMHAELLVIAVPVKAVRSITRQIQSILLSHNKKVLIVHVAKGLELNTHLRVSEVIDQETTDETVEDICVLGGPSHAEEVALKSPTTVSTASLHNKGITTIQDVFMSKYFRVYINEDLIGVEIGGALKNIIAIAVGTLDGLNFGDNAKAAIITRGLQEIARLGTKMGADPLTFLGLSGIGDLIVTATSQHSRNFRCGIMLAEGLSLEEAEEKMGMVVEGVNTTRAAYELSEEYGVEMPITKVLHQYLFDEISEEEAFYKLMMREKTSETIGLKELLQEQYKDWSNQ